MLGEIIKGKDRKIPGIKKRLQGAGGGRGKHHQLKDVRGGGGCLALSFL